MISKLLEYSIGHMPQSSDLSEEKRTVRVAFSGCLDVYSVKHVESLFPNPEDADRLALDCSEVSIIESALLTVLMRYRRAWERAGHDPLDIVIIVSPGVRRIFDITGLSGVMTILPSNSGT